MQLALYHDDVGQAADTGSAVHRAVELWHRGKSYDDALAEALAEAPVKYPKADPDETRLFFRPYTEDERNKNATIIESEKRITFECSADETRVMFQGTFDQLRNEQGAYVLRDLKTGKRHDGYQMLSSHAYQLYAYWYGAVQIGRKVDAVGVIRAYDYRSRTPGPVFWTSPASYQTAERAMKRVVRMVARLRRGEIDIVPGIACGICPAQTVTNCEPVLHSIGLA